MKNILSFDSCCKPSKKNYIFLTLFLGFVIINAQTPKTNFNHTEPILNSNIDSDILGRVSTHFGLQSSQLNYSVASNEVKSINDLDNWMLMDSEVGLITAEDRQERPEIAYGNSTYLVVWQDNRSGDFLNLDFDIFATRVTTSGEILDPYGIIVSATPGINASNPSVAFDGTNFLVIWAENPDQTNNYNIYGKRISPDGIILDVNAIEICTEYQPQILPGLAFNGTHYLAVWSDYREGEDFDIYGSLIDTNGTVLNPSGIEIYNTYENQAYIDVVSNGTDWLLAWGGPGDTIIRGTRVASDGSIPNTAGIIISTDANDRLWPDISYDGTNYMVVWQDRRAGTGVTYWSIYGCRIANDGTVLDPSGIPIADDNSYAEVLPQVQFDGTNYLVTWKDDGFTEITGAIVSTSGSILPPGKFPITNSFAFENFSALSHDGTNYMVVWQDRRAGTGVTYWSIYGCRIANDGTILDPSGIPIAVDNSFAEVLPQVQFDGTNYLITWKDDGFTEIAGSIVSTSGDILPPGKFPITNSYAFENFSALSHDGTNWFLCWEDFRNTQSIPPGTGADIFGARIDPNGNVLDISPNDLPISRSSNWQFNSDATFNGSDYFVVWQERVSVNQTDIKGTRVSSDGNPIDSPTISICSEIDDQAEPVITTGNSGYYTVWTDFRDNVFGEIYGSAISQDGVVLNPGGNHISFSPNVQRLPDVAFDGTNYLAVWFGYDNGYHVYGARVSEDGTILDPNSFVIAPVSYDYGWNNFIDISVDFDGENYLVVWSEFKSGDWDIYGALVTPDAQVVNNTSFPILDYVGNQYFPHVTFANGQYLVACVDDQNGGNDIYCTRVEPTGNILDPDGIALCTNYGEQITVKTGFNGINHVVVWTDWRANNPDVYGTAVRPNGEVTTLDGIPLSSDLYFQEYPTISGGSNGESMVFYSGYEPHTHLSTRIWGAVLSNNDLGNSEFDVQVDTNQFLKIAPNPFRESTKISFELQNSQEVNLYIYDITGNYISTIHNETLSAGYHGIMWDGRNDKGKKLGSGIYICRLEADGINETQKIILE